MRPTVARVSGWAPAETLRVKSTRTPGPSGDRPSTCTGEVPMDLPAHLYEVEVPPEASLQEGTVHLTLHRPCCPGCVCRGGHPYRAT